MDERQENPGVVLCAGDHRFADDAVVSFSEVQGMTELNGIGPVKITNLSDSERAFVMAAAPPASQVVLE